MVRTRDEGPVAAGVTPSPNAKRRLLPAAAVCFFVLCAHSLTRADKQSLPDGNAFRFDAGPKDSEVDAGFLGLDLKSAYASDVGFGWTTLPQREFSRPDTSRSRGPMTIDGVAGARVGFRADVEPGVWHVTIWLDALQLDATGPRVIVQGKERNTGWHTFPAETERRESAEKTYRVFHGTAVAGTEGIALELVADEDEACVMGLSLIRQVEPTTPKHRPLLTQLAAAGRLQSTGSLDELLKHTKELLRKDATDAFAALWVERLELLASAERLTAMRGWEWADEQTDLGMFDRLNQAVMLLDGLLGPDAAQAELLTDRALFLRGRLLYWLSRERDGPNEPDRGRRDLNLLRQRHPHDDLLAMYDGRKVDLPDGCDCLKATAAAPAWSTAQREALCRLRQISHWWVNERQAANGEFGGKFGDDVELLRWWSPLVLSGDEPTRRGWQRLADGTWHSKHVHEGYSRKLRDVEHAAEFVADTAPLMVLYSDDAEYERRLTYSARHFDTLWTGLTPNGHRFFRSAWYSSTALEEDEPKNRDLEYNARAVRAMRYLAWRRPDPHVEELLHQWSAAWLSAAMRTDKGKPLGIIPPSVRFPDEAINGDEPNWFQANMIWDYYEWEFHAGSLILDQLLFSYTLTSDEKYLQPMFLALELIRAEEAGLTDARQETITKGSRAWAADMLMRSRFFWSVVEQWRFLTNNSRWDELILRHGSPYGRFRITGDKRFLAAGLDRVLDTVRYNTPLMTSEAIHTDRVYVRGWEHLKAMLTGDGMPDNSSPYFAASWEKTDDGFTALISEAASDRLEVELFSHSPLERSIIMRLWQLTPGTYQLRCEPVGRTAEQRTISVVERGQRIALQLPSRRLLRISIRREPPS